MALSKSVTLPANGVVVSYWSIVNAEFLYSGQTINVLLAGYVSAAVQAAGGAPATVRFFRVNLSDIAGAADLHAVTTAQIYTAIMGIANAATSPDPLAGATSA